MRLEYRGMTQLQAYLNRMTDILISFNPLQVKGGGYNPNNGEHAPVTVERTEQPCNINALGIDREMKVFGEVDVGVIIARLQRPHHAPFDYAVVTEGIYKGKYRVKKQATHRSKSAFYLEGIK